MCTEFRTEFTKEGDHWEDLSFMFTKVKIRIQELKVNIRVVPGYAIKTYGRNRGLAASILTSVLNVDD
jgi:hypothetical protein